MLDRYDFNIDITARRRFRARTTATRLAGAPAPRVAPTSPPSASRKRPNSRSACSGETMNF
jgi:hypothetical protein